MSELGNVPSEQILTANNSAQQIRNVALKTTSSFHKPSELNNSLD